MEGQAFKIHFKRKCPQRQITELKGLGSDLHISIAKYEKQIKN